MKLKSILLGLMLFVFVLAGTSQEQLVLIHIKLIDGRTGNPMKNQQVGLEDRNGYKELSARTDEAGVASLKIGPDAIILTHNTDYYVNCSEERGGLVHNDFKVSQILSTGLVQKIDQPNLCGKTSGVARPGELILFERPWGWGERI